MGSFEGIIAVMKRLLIASVVCWASAWAANPAVEEVKSVYVLPMGNGLDQYLASELTSGSVVQIVTDPQRADAILTDKVGEELHEKLAELYPKPEPKKEAPKEGEAKEEKAKDTGSEMFRPKGSSWGRSKGTIFLVDRTSGDVIWSMYGQPKDNTPRNVARHAAKVAERLKKERTAPR